MDDAQQFCLRWHNHQSSVLSTLPRLLASGRLADVALSAGGQLVYAHRLVLCSCSHYFMDLFKEMPASSQPLVILVGCGIAELNLLLRFMYAGEVTAPRHLLPSLLRLAAALHVSGLAPDKTPGGTESTNEFEDRAQDDLQTSPPTARSEFKVDHFQTKENLKPDVPTSRGVDEYLVSETAENIDRTKKRKSSYPRQTGVSEKNKKLDRIVENLRSSQQTDKSPEADDQGYILQNLGALKRENSMSAADIFAYSNIFMENAGKSDNLPSSPFTDKIEEFLGNAQDATDETLQLETKSFDLTKDPGISDRSAVSWNPMSLDLGQSCSVPFLGQKYAFGSSSENAPGQDPVAYGFGSVAQNIFPNAAETLLGRGPAVCPICNKRLSNQYNLRVHMETHAGARHSCLSCGHVSRSRDALRKHVAYRHPPQHHNIPPRST